MFVLVRDFLAETAPEWTVEWASTYEAGVAGLTTGHYDAALLDYHLGAHTGVELLESLRTMDRLPPIVLLTGQGDRAIDLAAMATGASDYLDKGALSPALLERTVRHAIEREHQVVALVTSEAQYRGLFERAGDAVLIADDTGRYVDANPAACVLLGVTRDGAIGRSLTDFVVPWDDMPDPAVAWASFLAAGEMRGQVKIRRPDGTIRDADFLATANYTPGRHLSVLRDDTDRLAAQTALIEAVAALSSSEERFRAALDSVALPAVIVDTEGRLLFVNRHVLARTGWTDEELIGTNISSWLGAADEPTVSPEASEARTSGTEAFVDHIESTWRTKSGDPIVIAWIRSPITDDTGRIVAVASIGDDVTARREAEATQARLVAAIGQTAESVMVTDVKGRVVYANPAFAQMSGVAVADVMGKEPRSVMKGPGMAKAYPRVGRRLLSGRPWSGEWDLTRRDGTSYREEVTISPVRADHGQIVNFVRVARDVSRLHEVQASLASTTLGREAFARALARLQPRETLEETGQDITDAVGGLWGVDVAVLLTFEINGDARVLAVTAPDGHPFAVGERIPPAAAARLIERAGHGPWAEAQDDQVSIERALVWTSLGLEGVAYAPIDNGDGPIGLVALGTRDAMVAGRIDNQLPVAIEFAAAARGLIAGPMALRAKRRTSRSRIEGIISAGAFEPVFQPIVRMATGEAIGFEALTRFHDGTRPDHLFAEATTAGAGLDLETATLAKAMAAAQGLPAGAWLSVNVSAALILEPDRLAQIINRRTRPVVLEITEHDSITDYAAVGAAIALLGPDVRLAVDDAGAGVANFSHIVALRPDFVKIDSGLVRGVNHDLTRQALIVGLGHFARATNGWLISEGVETEQERQTLLGLGLEYGQGYLFGRPAGAHAWAPAMPPLRAARLGKPAASAPTVPGVIKASRILSGSLGGN
jgi:PAS domain S-box-containing protein